MKKRKEATLKKETKNQMIDRLTAENELLRGNNEELAQAGLDAIKKGMEVADEADDLANELDTVKSGTRHMDFISGQLEVLMRMSKLYPEVSELGQRTADDINERQPMGRGFSALKEAVEGSIEVSVINGDVQGLEDLPQEVRDALRKAIN